MSVQLNEFMELHRFSICQYKNLHTGLTDKGSNSETSKLK